jgi:hypothetical protein
VGYLWEFRAYQMKDAADWKEMLMQIVSMVDWIACKALEMAHIRTVTGCTPR